MEKLIKWQSVFVLAAIIAVNIVVFSPSFGGDFLNWDDDRYVVKNSHVGDLNLNNLRHAFGGIRFQSYHPLHLVSYMIDGCLWSGRPVFYRLHSLFVYLVSIILFFYLLRLLRFDVASSAFGCLVFSIAPYRAETVAWISNRKDVLMLFFSLVGWHLHLKRGVGRQRAIIQALATLSFVAAMLSKSAAMVVPGMVLASDIGLRRLPVLQALKSSWLYFVPAISVAVVVPFFWAEAEMIRPSVEGGFLGSLKLVGWTLAHYVKTAAWPFYLSPLYAEPSRDALLQDSFIGIGFVLALFSLAYLAHKQGRSMGDYAVALLWFLIGLMPFYNYVPLYYLVADRYLLFPSFGIALLGALLSRKALSQKAGSMRALFCVVFILLLTSWSAATFVECRAWSSSEELWRHAVLRQPDSFYSRLKLGETYRDLGKPEKSAEQYLAARKIRPGSPGALGGLFWAEVLVDSPKANISSKEAEQLAYKFVAMANNGPKLLKFASFLKKRRLNRAAQVVLDRVYGPMR